MVKSDMSNHHWAPVDRPFETEDEDLCPLCMEELDISDLNFRPCPCGYRICRFCWHHIKEDLNRRCPGCRKEYDDSVVEFKPMKAEELKRFQLAKKQREKERKDLELANRKHLANVRVKQKNQVHVQGLTTKIANEDTVAQLKSSELFSQYGRIHKMFMSRRTGPTSLFNPDSRYQHVNLYINFSRNTEALTCIQGIDGMTLPDGHRLKASLGSTKYCASFLRGLKCTNDNCTGAHELAEEVEGSGSTAREDMSTARHAQKESEGGSTSKSSAIHPTHPTSLSSGHPVPSGVALPATASWATKSNSTSQPASPANSSLPLPRPPSSTSLATPKSAAKGHAGMTPKPIHALPLKPTRQGSCDDLKPGPPLVNASVNPLPPSSASTSGPSQSSYQPRHESEQETHTVETSELQSVQTQGPSQTSISSATAANSTSQPSTPHTFSLLPPGLSAPPPALDKSSPATGLRNSTLLPPGLHSSTHKSAHDVNWSKGTAIPSTSSSLPLDKLPVQTAACEASVLSSFSPNFGTPCRFNSASDLPLGSLSLIPCSRYSGTFNPFADTDFPASAGFKDDDSFFSSQQQPSLAIAQHPNRLGDRRGSRFGFARRDSAVPGATSAATSPSPLRSIFSVQPDVPASPRGQHILHQLRATPASASRLADTGTHVVSSATDSITPDASVLFPGVNLAASYSANALPAALARGNRSPGAVPPALHLKMDIQAGPFRPLSASHTRDSLSVQANRANERLPFESRQTALSPTTFSHLHASNHHDHPNTLLNPRERRLDLNAGVFGMPAQFLGNADLASEFQDPAILNMRMANNGSNGYPGPMLQGGEGSHPVNELYPTFSMNAGFQAALSGRPTFHHPSGNPQDLHSLAGPPQGTPNGTGRLPTQSYYNLTTTGTVSGQQQQQPPPRR